MKKIIGITTLLVFGITALAVDQWFTWTKNPDHELVSGYRIEYKKLPQVTNWTYISFTPYTTNRAVIKGLQGGYTYYFRVFAVNSVGIGTNTSNVIQMPTNAPTAVLNFAPTNAP